MRVKESSDDYRYFPEPDLPPLRVDGGGWSRSAPSMPELPAARRERLRAAWDWRRRTPSSSRQTRGRGACSRRRARGGWDAARRKARQLGDRRVPAAGQGGGGRRRGGSSGPGASWRPWCGWWRAGELSGTNAKEVFALHAATRPAGGRASSTEAGFKRISDTGALRTWRPQAVIDANPTAVADVRAGKVQAIGFLTGQVMKQTRGQADAATVGALLRELLGLA